MSKQSWIAFFSQRMIGSKRRSRSSVTALLSAFGLAMGCLTLISVISVMNGFQSDTIEDLVEINSFHLRISGPYEDDLPDRLEQLSGLRRAAQIIETQVLIEGWYGSNQGAMIKALDPKLLSPGSDFRQRLGLSDEQELSSGQVLLGRELARFLGANVGDYISVLSLGGSSLDITEPVTIELEVAGTFYTGYYEYDRNWGIVGLNDGSELLGADYRRQIAVSLDNRNRDLAAIETIRQNFPEIRDNSIESWRQYNRSIFGALRVEKAMMIFLVGLIFLVVGVNIFQGLRRSVHEHLEEVAVLKVMGASDAQLRLVFILEGLLIGLMGTAIGVVAGVLIAANINGIFAALEHAVNFVLASGNFSLFSPSYFYLQEVPSKIIPGEVVLIASFSLLSALASAYGASKRITGLKPREVLNNE